MEKRTGISVQVVIYRMKPGSDKEILVLGLRKAVESKSWWQPVTGGVLEGEELADAALRETREETGLPEPVKFRDLEHNHVLRIPERIRKFCKEGIKSVREYSFAFQTDREEVTLAEEHTGYTGGCRRRKRSGCFGLKEPGTP